MNNKINFYLARHGQTEWNLQRRIQGQLDSGLTQAGQQQASLLAVKCADLNITQILTSPLGRAVDTANICAQYLQLPVKQIVGFEERHFGDWQGKLVSEMKSNPNYVEITSQITDCQPNQGESAKQLLTRFQNTLIKQLEASSDEINLIISHGDILRCFMAKWFAPDLQSQVHVASTTASPVIPATSTGYDYQNAQLIALSYDIKTGTFSTL